MMAIGPAVALGMWSWVFLLGGVSMLPMGGVPRDLDPALAAVGPEGCLLYAASAGMQPADPASSNAVEQLLAEPSVVGFGSHLEEVVLRALRRAAGPERHARILGEEIPVLLQAMWACPWAGCVEEVRAAERGLEIDAYLVLSAGERRPEVERALERLVGLVGAMPGAGADRPRESPSEGPAAGTGQDQLAIETEIAAGITWTRLRFAPQLPPLRWGWHDNYLIVALGPEPPLELLERLRREAAEAPAWLRKIRAEHAVEREATLTYVNMAAIWERLAPLADANPPVATMLEALGLTSIQEVHQRSGFDATGCVRLGHIVTEGSPEGLLALLPSKPLGKRDLRAIPADALLAAVARWDANDAWGELERMLEEVSPRSAERLQRALWEIETQFGVHLRDDVLRSLGDVWWKYVPSGDISLAWVNAVAGVEVKDATPLSGAIDKLATRARAEMRPGRGQPVALRESKVGQHTLYSLEFAGMPIPLAPSWCVGEKQLVFGLLPQTVRGVLEREEFEATLADKAEVAAMWEGSSGPAALVYHDTPRLVQSLYPMVQMGLQMASSTLRGAGLELDASQLPGASTVVGHLRPSVMAVHSEADGFHLVARTSSPGQGPLLAVAPLAAGMFGWRASAVGTYGSEGGYQSPRAAANRMADTNTLKQLALAVHNYASTYGKLPGDIYNEEGKALLSWRVAVLPFLENAQLYAQLRLDEAWDSPHNGPLLQQAPAFFQSRGAAGPPGTTRFLGLAGDKLIFRGREEVRFRDVTDGLSNTLLMVQVAPAAALPWAKPGDLPFDSERPKAGLGNAGSFLAALGDGSVRSISLAIDAEVLRALVTPSGGEVIPPAALGE